VNTEHSRWSDDIARFNDDIALVAHKPKFTLSPKAAFFCIGSCFARNIEEHLLYAGHRVLSKKAKCPSQEWPYRINGFVNKFTTHSMANEIEWLCNPPVIDESLFEEGPHGWSDLQLCPGVRPVTLHRAMERRSYVIDDYFSRLRNADVIVITLGLNEVWRDAKSRRYLNATPSLASVRREADRYSVEFTDVALNVAELDRIYRLLHELNSNFRMIVTVSPVPMDATFSGFDIAVANTYSKAILRVSGEQFARNHSDVDYFPSFDMISLSPRAVAYKADCLHVTEESVRRVIGEFLRIYMGEEISAITYEERAYLAANPDVEAAARRGEYESGFEHWQRFGQAERRPLVPGVIPPP
jgi:hypothetical protein